MKRFLLCIGLGLVIGFLLAMSAAATIGTIYAEDLAPLVPRRVQDSALRVANWLEGYEE